MNRFVALVLLALAIPFIAGGQSAPGAVYKSDGEGWQIQPPKTWKHAVKDGKLMIGSDTETGLMLAWFQVGLTYEQAQEYAKQPYQESGLVLMPSKATPFATKAGKAFAVDYSGKAMDGSMIKSRSITIAGAKGVIYVAGVTTEPQFAALSKKTDEMAKTVTFFTPKVAAGGAGASLIKGPMCAWSGSSGYSSSSKMFSSCSTDAATSVSESAWAWDPTSRAGCHVAPLSVETSTLAISVSPAQAKPATVTRPGFSTAPSSGAVMSDFTTSPVSGAMSFASTAAPGATRLVGYR